MTMFPFLSNAAALFSFVSCKILPGKTQNAGTWELDPDDRIKVFERLVAANHRGEIYDYDVSSILPALCTGWDWREHTPEEELTYINAIVPRLKQGDEGGFFSAPRLRGSIRGERITGIRLFRFYYFVFISITPLPLPGPYIAAAVGLSNLILTIS